MARKFSLESAISMVDKYTVPLQDAYKKSVSFSQKTQKSFNGLSGSVDKFYARLDQGKDRFQTLSTASAGLTMAGQQATSAGKTILSAFDPIISEGREFEKTMSNVAAISRLDKTSDQFKQLEQSARDLGATTQFSAKEAADGMGFLAMAGFDAEKIIKTMPGMLKLAQAGNLDLARTADIASNTLGAFKMDAGEMTRVANVMAATFTRSNVDMEMLAETFKYAAPIANSVGVSIEQLAAMTGLLGDVGIQGSNAGTALRAAMVRLAKPPKMAQHALANLGIATKDTTGKMRDMPDILEDIRIKTQKMGSGMRLEYIASIFGTEASAAFAELISKADESGKSISNFAKTIQSATAADELNKIAETMSDNFDGAAKSFQSARSEFYLIAWDAIKQPLTSLLKMITKVTRAIGEWTKRHPKLAKYIMIAIALIGSLLVVMGLLMTFAGIVAGGFIMMSIASGMLGGSLWLMLLPFLKFILIASIIVAAVMLLISYWDDFINLISDAYNGFYKLFSSLPGWVQTAIQVFSALLMAFNPLIGIPLFILTNWEYLKEGVLRIINVISNAISSVKDFLGFGGGEFKAVKELNTTITENKTPALTGNLLNIPDQKTGQTISKTENYIENINKTYNVNNETKNIQYDKKEMQMSSNIPNYEKTQPANIKNIVNNPVNSKKIVVVPSPGTESQNTVSTASYNETVNKSQVDINVNAPKGTTAEQKGNKSKNMTLNLGVN